MKSTLVEHKTTSLRIFNDCYITHFLQLPLKSTRNKGRTFYDYPTDNFNNVCKQVGKIVCQLFALKSYLLSVELTGRAISFPGKPQVLVY